MKSVIDTNIIIDLEENNYSCNNFYFTDISLYELLKHKTHSQKEEKYNSIISFMKENNIDLISKNLKLIKVFGLEYKKIKKRVDKAILNVYKNMMKNFSVLITFLIQIIYLKLNNIHIEDGCFVVDEDKENEDTIKFINALGKSTHSFLKNYTHVFCEKTLKLKDNINDCRLEITLLNLCNLNFDKLIKQQSKNIHKVNHFIYEELVKGNGIMLKPSEIIKAFDSLIYFKENSSLSRDVLLAYAFEILLNGGKIEYNDIVDMNIFSLAYVNDACFITKDRKIFKVLKNYEDKMGIENIYTKRIITCKNIQEIKKYLGY